LSFEKGNIIYIQFLFKKTKITGLREKMDTVYAEGLIQKEKKSQFLSYRFGFRIKIDTNF